MSANHPLLDGLNDEQACAVAAPAGHHLVLAGAGSGKTRVLTHRIAWYNQELGIPLHGIVAVTFTNKAAKEMKERLVKLLGPAAQGMWIGTFHGLCHRILRMHPLEAGLPDDFQIIDTDDQVRLIKQIIADLDMEEDKMAAKEIAGWISRNKDEGLRPHQVRVDNEFDGLMRTIYRLYQERADKLGLVDFGELLLRCQEVFENHPALLAQYQKRFSCLLVDEFQDTNNVQYKWVVSLLGTSGQGFVVADDAQAIYGWRGAKVDNVLKFVDDHKASIWRLERNYRSTANILSAANALIEKNPSREDFKKKLWTEQADGEPVHYLQVKTEIEEGELVASAISKALAAKVPASECAILYRSNAQSRVLEESLVRRRIPYRIYGGLRFFDRAEIKDSIAYLRLTSNRQDDVSFERVINTPTRGIGASTIDAIRIIANKNNLSRWEAAQIYVDQDSASARSKVAVKSFLDLIDRLEDEASPSMAGRIKAIIHESGLLDYHVKQSKGETNSRGDNLEELVSVGSRFRQDESEKEAGWSATQSFLVQVALEPVDAESQEPASQVQMMTIHSAKGLEFDLVFLVGWEEGLFPSARSVDDPERLNEERRLAYVAITRARKKLAVLHAKTRRIYGKEQDCSPSRFLREIPGALKTTSGSISIGQAKSIQEAKPGQPVKHTQWGEGILVRKDDVELKVLVAFKAVGAKWIPMNDPELK